MFNFSIGILGLRDREEGWGLGWNPQEIAAGFKYANSQLISNLLDRFSTIPMTFVTFVCEFDDLVPLPEDLTGPSEIALKVLRS